MKTDAELYDAYLDAAKVGGKENAHAGLRAVYNLGRADERPPTFREEVEADYQAWRATQTPEQLAAWDARYNQDGSPVAKSG
jgi:hypothetical protein